MLEALHRQTVLPHNASLGRKMIQSAIILTRIKSHSCQGRHDDMPLIIADRTAHLVCLHADGEVKGLGTGSQHATALPEELHTLYFIVHQQGGRFLDIEESTLQRVQIAVICLHR